VIDRRLRASVLLGEARALGLGLADLIAAARTDADDRAASGPTVSGYLATIAPTFTAGTAATYRPYWRLAVARLGDRRLADVAVADLQTVVADAVARARRRRPDSDGRASQESCVAALRALFSRAVADGLMRANPAAGLTKPRRTRSRRRALDDAELAELIDAVRTTSNDPDLDLLLVRFHLESGARRGGALNLRCEDLDARRATVWLREKGASEREQPVSPTLITLLECHPSSRGGSGPDSGVFRTACGTPITRRRYDIIFDRARACLTWSDRIPVSAHVLRHTAITAIGRLAGYPAAQAFAGHSPPSVTGLYLQASPAEVATAVAAMTGEAHPSRATIAGAAPPPADLRATGNDNDDARSIGHREDRVDPAGHHYRSTLSGSPRSNGVGTPGVRTEDRTGSHRLERLGFSPVYDYSASKVDWMATGQGCSNDPGTAWAKRLPVAGAVIASW
jgi:integrase/recombinase XerC